MELRQLEYVLGIVDHGGFTRAAEALYVAQPSLSQSVRRLEAELGVQLFHRLGRRTVLSSAGQAFVTPARQVLRDMATLRRAVAEAVGLLTGVLDVAALPSLAAHPVAPLLGAFRTAHPGVSVRMADPDDPVELIGLVTDGRCEIGFTELPGPPSELVAVPLADQELFVVAPPGTELGAAPGPDDMDDRVGRVPLADLREQALIVPPIGTSSRDLVDRGLATLGVELPVAVETAQREAIVPLVLSGAGCAFLPAPLAYDARRRGAVVAPVDPPLVRTIGLLHRPGPLSPAGRELVRQASLERTVDSSGT
jgi:DNA-binding transcriptional LysR family regulator